MPLPGHGFSIEMDNSLEMTNWQYGELNYSKTMRVFSFPPKNIVIGLFLVYLKCPDKPDQ